MCSKRSGRLLKSIGVFFLLLLLVSSPLYSVDIADEDWEIVSSYVLTSEKVLPQLSQTLKTVETRLDQSEQELTSLQNKQSQLEISLENMNLQVTKLTRSNNVLKIATSIGITIGVAGIVTSLIFILN